MRNGTDVAGPDRGPGAGAVLWLKDRLPSPWVNSVLHVGPAWFRFHDVLALGVLVLTGVVWGLTEYRWASWSVTGLVKSAWKRFSSRF